MEQQTELRCKLLWTTEDDGMLRDYVIRNGARCWETMARILGRSGNSCRLRWVNYLSPLVRREDFTDDEIIMILNLHHEYGNRWSKIAEKLSGRTDNRIKNFWNTRLKKEAKRMNCDVESEEFRQMMTARLTESVSLTTPADPGGNTSSDHDQGLMSDHQTLNVDDQDCNSDEIWDRFNADHECTNDEYWARLGFYLEYL